MLPARPNKLYAFFIILLLFTLSACQTELAATKGSSSSLAPTNTLFASPTLRGTVRRPFPTDAPVPTATTTPEPTETVFVQYDAPLDKASMLAIKYLPNDYEITPTISSYSTKNYNPIVFVVPAGLYNTHKAIEFLGGVYKGKGVSIYDF